MECIAAANFEVRPMRTRKLNRERSRAKLRQLRLYLLNVQVTAKLIRPRFVSEIKEGKRFSADIQNGPIGVSASLC